MEKSFIIFLSLFAFLYEPISGDRYAAVVELEELVKLERVLRGKLEEYVKLEKNRIQRLKAFAQNVRDVRNTTQKSDSDLKDSPEEAVSVAKRLATGWKEIGQVFSEDLAKDLKKELEINKFRLPNASDELRGAVAALFRLQETYNISAQHIADGLIPGTEQNARLSTEECFELGSVAYKNGRYSQAYDWLNAALRLHEAGHHENSLTKKDLLEHVAWAEYLRGNTEKALNLTFEILQIEPNQTRSLENLMFYKKLIESKARGSRETHEQLKARDEERSTAAFTQGDYASMCRGEIPELPKKIQKKLKCWYHGRKSPLLLLRPIKVEQAYHDPNIYILREFISDSEIKEVIDLAKPMLKRATVFNPQTGVLEYADYRTSKSAWLTSNDSEVIGRIDARMSALTGLTVATAEDLQVQNYGLAGQYEYHYDFGDPGSPLEKGKNGNRIATVIIYFNDARAGGATVFTKLKTYIKPTKGDAAMWWNLKRSGAGDYRTEHAGCPVLSGVKWVANKWFHMHGQEFRRPCVLDPNL